MAGPLTFHAYTAVLKDCTQRVAVAFEAPLGWTILTIEDAEQLSALLADAAARARSTHELLTARPELRPVVVAKAAGRA